MSRRVPILAAGLMLLAAKAVADPLALPVPTVPPPGAQPPATLPAAAPDPAPDITVSPSPASARPKVARPPDPIPEPVKLSDDPRPTLGPGTFTATLAVADRYRRVVEAGGWPTVPGDAQRLQPGDTNATVRALQQRLTTAGDLAAMPAVPTFDPETVAALKRFQFRHGLEETGTVGPRTLANLNVSAETRLHQLQASAGRLLGSRFPFGDRYVAVNIPSAAVEAVDHGTVIRRYTAVVGKPDRPSPVVETRVTSINFNPTWTVPVSLIRKDIIPHVRKDPGYLAKMKIRLFDGTGREIDPATVDWSTERAVNYTIRQDAGTANSLGEIRIDMPNAHSVYMHDTPSKRLFARTARFQSSGCVRVAGVKSLAAWLLEGTMAPSGGPAAGPHWSEADIDASVATGRRLDAKLARPVPVAWVYLTGYGMPDGTAHFRDDIYGLDQPAQPAGTNPTAAPAATASLAPERPLTLDALITSSIGATRRP